MILLRLSVILLAYYTLPILGIQSLTYDSNGNVFTQYTPHPHTFLYRSLQNQQYSDSNQQYLNPSNTQQLRVINNNNNNHNDYSGSISRSLSGPYTSSYTSTSYDTYTSQGCARNPCGTNAHCQDSASGHPVCTCPAGYQGSPLTFCRRADCLDHSECRSDQACRNGVCVNPCAGACASNANCEISNHVPVCSCPRNHKGDPFTSCRLMDPEELCHPSPCGSNTNCEIIGGTPTCSCLPGYIGSPLSGCRHECESDSGCGQQEYCDNFKCKSACSQCGKGADCSRVVNHRAVCECPTGYIGSPHTECRPECYGDVDCPSGRPACYYGICKNPCIGACGIGADCNLRGLTPVCSCPKTHTGNPFVSCRPFTPEDLCTPNPCGTNAICTPGHDNTNKERPVCTCPAGYTGNALSICHRGECLNDGECANNRACISYQCVDPCVGQVCGQSAICETRNHKASCTCPNGFNGDARVTCRQSRTGGPAVRYNKK